MGKSDIKTNPATGETCMLLNKTERKQLAGSKSTLRLYAALNAGNPLGKIAGEICGGIGELLRCDGKPPVDSPDPNPKEDPLS